MKTNSDQNDVFSDPELNESITGEGAGGGSNRWMFIVVDHLIGDKTVLAKNVLADRVKQKIWLLNSKNPRLRYLREGDEVIFYLGGKGGSRGFAGIGVLTSDPRPLKGSESAKFGLSSSKFDQVVELRDLKLWRRVKPVGRIVPRLNFIKKKESWGAYLQGGIIHISKQDFELLIEA